LSESIQERFSAKLKTAPAGVRGRLITLPLHVRDGEERDVAFKRLKAGASQVFRVLFGRPSSANDWEILERVFCPDGFSRRSDRAAAKRRVLKIRKRYASGGVYRIEFGEQNMNPHVHMVMISPYVKQARLSRCWELVTGDSVVTDIRAVRDIGGVARELLKYVTKFTTRSANDLAELYEGTLSVSYSDEKGDSVRSHRMVEAVGSLRGREASEDEDLEPLRCDSCGSVVRPVEVVPWQLVKMGVYDPPEHRLFRRTRAPPTKTAA